MITNKNLKKRGSENKRIICICATTDVIIIGAMSYVITKQQIDIKKK